MLQAIICDDILKIKTKNRLIKDSVNTYKIKFEFDVSWNSLNKMIVYKIDDVVVHAPILENIATIPANAISLSGVLKFGVYGTEIVNNILTIRKITNYDSIRVENGAYEKGNDPSIPNPSIWDTYIADINVKVNEAKIAKEGAEAAKNLAITAKTETIAVRDDVILLKTEIQSIKDGATSSSSSALKYANDAAASAIKSKNSANDSNLSALDSKKFRDEIGDVRNLFISVSNGKEGIAAAITDKGILTTADNTFLQMSDNIRKIEKGIDIADINPNDIVEGVKIGPVTGTAFTVKNVFADTRILTEIKTTAIGTLTKEMTDTNMVEIKTTAIGTLTKEMTDTNMVEIKTTLLTLKMEV